MISETRLISDGLDRVRESVAALTDGTSAEDLVRQPAAGANSRSWLIWHLSRVIDHQGLSVLSALRGDDAPEQVWTAQGFAERLGLPYERDASGYGQSAQEVAAFPAIDPAELRAYHDAVQDAAHGWLDSLDAADLDTVIDAHWDPPVTARARLVSVLDDAARHIGQAEYVTGLLAGN